MSWNICRPLKSPNSTSRYTKCWIAAGRCHAYLHGKQKLWDYAAGHLILAETGGYSCNLSGEPVFQPRLEPRSAVAALELELFLEWSRWLGIQSA